MSIYFLNSSLIINSIYVVCKSQLMSLKKNVHVKREHVPIMSLRTCYIHACKHVHMLNVAIHIRLISVAYHINVHKRFAESFIV